MILITHLNQSTILNHSDQVSIKAALIDHLMRLDPDDRYERFFNLTSKEVITRYVNDLTLARGIFIATDTEEQAKIIAFLHASHANDLNHIELGLTVDDDYRRQRIGQQLVKDAIEWAQTIDCHCVLINFLFHNHAIRSLVKKFNMETLRIDNMHESRLIIS